MRTRGLFFAVLVTVLLGSVSVTTFDAGAQQKVTKCSWSDTGAVEPGFSTEPSSGTYSTAGETGTVECDGPVYGQQPTGPGTIGFEATYGVDGPSSCQSGGKGAYAGFMTLPTANGRLHVVDYGSFDYGAIPEGGGLYGGSFEGEVFEGTFQSAPTKGDCVTGVTEVRFEVKDAIVHVPRKKKL